MVGHDMLAKEGIWAEVIDPRTSSLIATTGRLVVADEGGRRYFPSIENTSRTFPGMRPPNR